MHALFVTAHIDAGRNEEEGVKFLQSDVLPQLKQFPGVVGGYWLATKNSESLAVVLFDNEDAAKQMAEGRPSSSASSSRRHAGRHRGPRGHRPHVGNRIKVWLSQPPGIGECLPRLGRR